LNQNITHSVKKKLLLFCHVFGFFFKIVWNSIPLLVLVVQQTDKCYDVDLYYFAKLTEMCLAAFSRSLYKYISSCCIYTMS
jgi:hypothetical protein